MTAADTLEPPPAVVNDNALADGVHIGLPIARYIALRALSGSAFDTLLCDPPSYQWESDANPLWLQPERSKQRAQLRGSAAHTLTLEGPEAYAAEYCVKPADVLSTQEELKDFLRAAKAKHMAGLGVEKLSQAEAKPFVMTGDTEALVARCRALDPEVKIWDGSDPRDLLLENDDAYVRFVANFLRRDPAVQPYITDGLAELTFIWTAGGIRFKSRPDYLTGHTVADLKTFGRPPRRLQGLRAHCVREACFNGADLQAVHNHAAVLRAAKHFAEGKLPVHLHGGATGEDATKLAAILDFIQTHRDEKQPRPKGHPRAGGGEALMFRWIFVRMGGAPSSIVLPFRTSAGAWGEARTDIDVAIEEYRKYVETCGLDGIWAAALGEVEIEDTDFPLLNRESV